MTSATAKATEASRVRRKRPPFVAGARIKRIGDILRLNLDKRARVIEAMTPLECAQLFHDWSFWARPEQAPPAGDWIIWLILAGRGAGKTRAGAEAVRNWVQTYPIVNLIGATVADVRDTMVRGESAFSPAAGMMSGRRKAAQEQLTASHQEVGRLLADARRQTAEITQISEFGSLLQACTSREEVFRLIPERLRRLFPGASGYIALLSSTKNRLESVAKWGICPADQIFSPEQCWALRRGCIHAHSSGHSGPRCSHLLGDGPSVCIPLIANGHAFGMLSVQDDDPPHPVPDPEVDSDAFARRRHLAVAVSEHIALSVANLSLRESLRLQAIRDPLTGLYNRRYMQEFLERELHSARRKHRPLAVMMLDLDHFKRYNDSFGHSAGDQALAAVGEMLMRSVRAEDIACRYGGEEFILILPECSLRQALARAHEIRRRFRESSTQPDRKTADLSFSIGVAAFDETTDRGDLLLKFADDALYEAKRAGRDRVVAARAACDLPELNFTDKHPVTTA